MRRSVDFPEPLGPTRAANSLARTVRSTPSSTGSRPYANEMSRATSTGSGLLGRSVGRGRRACRGVAGRARPGRRVEHDSHYGRSARRAVPGRREWRRWPTTTPTTGTTTVTAGTTTATCCAGPRPAAWARSGSPSCSPWCSWWWRRSPRSWPVRSPCSPTAPTCSPTAWPSRWRWARSSSPTAPRPRARAPTGSTGSRSSPRSPMPRCCSRSRGTCWSRASCASSTAAPRSKPA